MKQTVKEDAVSPVVGVMLMVVVTIVIAAVITVFATGLIGDESATTPVVKIDVGDINAGGYLYSVEFIHKGGDVLMWENIEVSLVGETQLITNYFPGEYGTLTIFGKSGAGVIAEAGDYIKLTINTAGVENPLNTYYYPGEEVVWTMYDKRTEGIIANGKFIVE